MRLAVFGSSLVSAYWNGAATYYRGLLRALAERGHHVTFFEPDAYERQAHRDIPDPEWAQVIVYEATEGGVRSALGQARRAEVVIKCSGVGVFDELLEREVLQLATPTRRVGFCDVDAPATLEKALNDQQDAFRALIPAYDFVFTYGGGEPVRSRYLALGARECVPIYNALDPSTHHEVASDARFSASLGFLGNRLPDREARVDEFFFRTARELSTATFVLGGSGWHDKPFSPNVRYVGHVGTADHNAFNCTPRAVLNISRDSMASYGFSPATRVFEAAGAGACIITDAWQGVELFLEPGREILVAGDAHEVSAHLASLTPERAREIGQRAKSRVLREHTYSRRAQQLEELLLSVQGRDSARRAPPGTGSERRATLE
jgi:spore maturation protein CgeB